MRKRKRKKKMRRKRREMQHLLSDKRSSNHSLTQLPLRHVAACIDPEIITSKPSLSLHAIQRMVRECTRTKDLVLGRRLLLLACKDHLDAMPVLADQLIRMFVSCGSLLSANHTFGNVLKPSLRVWYAIVFAHASLGHLYIALELFYCMCYHGNTPSKVLFTCVLKICSQIRDSGTGRRLHHAISCMKATLDVSVSCSLVDMYLKFGCLQDAKFVFTTQDSKDVVIWSAMMGGCIDLGESSIAIDLFHRMQKEHLNPDRVVYLCLLKACVQMQNICLCLLVHTMITESCLDHEAYIMNSLVDMYSKQGMFEDSLAVFNEEQHKDMISWGALFSGYALHGDGYTAFSLFNRMLSQGLKPNSIVFVCLLKACTRLNQIHYVHDLTLKSDLITEGPLGNAFVDIYAKFGCLEEAHVVFNYLKCRDDIAWTSLIAGYAQNACGGLGAILEGRLLHSCAIRSGFDSTTVVINALIDMYVKCGSLEEARRSFNRLLDRDLVSWAVILGGYADNGLIMEAIKLFSDMLQKGMEPNKVSYLSILKAISKVGSFFLGKMIHHRLIRSGFEADISVGNTLVDAYCKSCALEESVKVFDMLSDHTVVSWSAIMAGHAQHEHDFTVLQFFERMVEEGIEPNRSIFLSALKACGSIGAVTQGSMIYNWVLRTGCGKDVEIGNSLLDMYAKCGFVQEAHATLQLLQTRSLVSWASIIAAHSSRGDINSVRLYFNSMLKEGLRPDGVVFMSVLMACAHSGEKEQGRQFFKAMCEGHCIAPSNEHFTCMIDLLGRAGCLTEAKQYLEIMPVSSDVSGWIALLTACDIYTSVELAKVCFDELMKLDPTSTAGYALMLKIYADALMWEDFYTLGKCMSSLGMSTMSMKTTQIGSEGSRQDFFMIANLDSKSQCSPTSLQEVLVAKEKDDLEHSQQGHERQAVRGCCEGFTKKLVDKKFWSKDSPNVVSDEKEIRLFTAKLQNLTCNLCSL